MIMYGKMEDSERNANTWSRFFETVRKMNSRRFRSDLEYYTHSAVPSLLTIQSCIKQEQL